MTKRTALLTLALLLTLAAVRPAPAHANGVPIRIPLTYVNGVSNWGPAGASGDAELSLAEATVRLDARGLPALQGEQYQLWLVRSGTNRAVSLGTFTAPADGIAGYTGKFAALDTYDYDLLMVTVEPLLDADPSPSAKRSIGGFFTPIKKAESAPGGAGITSDVRPAELPKTGDDPLPQKANDADRHRKALMLFAVGGGSLFLTWIRMKRGQA